MNTYVQGSHPAALCQPPPPGVRDERLDALLNDLMLAKHPPTELVNRCLDTWSHVARVSARSMLLGEIAGSGSLIDLASYLAEASDHGDPYDCDAALHRDAEALGQAAAVSMLLRAEPVMGDTLSDAIDRYLRQRTEPYIGICWRQAVDAATALLLAVRRGR